MVSDQWRELSAEEKEKWEEMAREDKARYLKQKEEYAGPWKVPADMKKPKDPSAPKKPTPAYFSFSNERRQSVKKDNPTASNGEISKILSKMWKEVDDATRAKYVEKEKKEREEYNKAVDQWKKERKESGRDNWWEFEQPAETGGRKRQKLDLLANTAGSRQDTDPSAANLMPQVGGVMSLPQSLQDQLSALSNQQINGSFLASLLPGLTGQGSLSNNTFGGNMQALNQQQLGAGGGMSLGGLFGSSPTGGAFQNTGMQINQSNLLASLLGGNRQQQQTLPSNAQGINDFLLTSLLAGSVQQQQQPQNLQSLQSSLLQQGFSGNSLLQNDQGNSNSVLASFLNQQQQQIASSIQSQSDPMSILQNLMQQHNPAQFQHQQQSYQQPQNNSTALEEALARLISGNNGGSGSYP
jgi:hypothetical protein